jgi:hypothetical protein
MEAQEPIDITFDDMHAVHDHMGKTLRVYGTALIKGGGFAVTLRPWERSGINDRLLMLALKVTPTAESSSQQPLHYEAAWGDQSPQYLSVGFVAEGFPAAPPPALDIEDVY